MLAFTALKTLCKKRCSKNWVSKRLSKVEAPGTITPRGFFIMYCEACGTQLPLGAKACPNCGTLTPAYYADSSVSPHDSTQAASGSSFDALVAPPPSSTQYGTNQYDASLQNPYEVTPYTAPAPAPPPPQPPRKVSPAMLGILIVLVILLIAGASVGFVLLRNNQARANLPPSVTSGPTRNTDNAAVNATGTASAFYSLYDTDTSSSLPTKNDPLSNNSQGLQWDEGQGCTFTGGAYHVSNTQSSGVSACMAHKSNFSDFLCQVQMTIIKGSYGSLIFRSNDALSNFYIFREGQDGVFTFAKYSNSADTEIEHSPSLAFKQGPNQTNLLAVIVQGSHLIFYINAQYVYDTYDTSFRSGEIGLVAGSIGSPTEVVYNNLKIWAL